MEKRALTGGNIKKRAADNYSNHPSARGRKSTDNYDAVKNTSWSTTAVKKTNDQIKTQLKKKNNARTGRYNQILSDNEECTSSDRNNVIDEENYTNDGRSIG